MTEIIEEKIIRYLSGGVFMTASQIRDKLHLDLGIRLSTAAVTKVLNRMIAFHIVRAKQNGRSPLYMMKEEQGC